LVSICYITEEVLGSVRIPVPKKGESRKDFISRCIPFVIREGTTKDPKQATAICNSIWRKKKGVKKSTDLQQEALNTIKDIQYLIKSIKKMFVNK